MYACLSAPVLGPSLLAVDSRTVVSLIPPPPKHPLSPHPRCPALPPTAGLSTYTRGRSRSSALAPTYPPQLILPPRLAALRSNFLDGRDRRVSVLSSSRHMGFSQRIRRGFFYHPPAQSAPRSARLRGQRFSWFLLSCGSLATTLRRNRLLPLSPAVSLLAMGDRLSRRVNSPASLNIWALILTPTLVRCLVNRASTRPPRGPGVQVVCLWPPKEQHLSRWPAANPERWLSLGSSLPGTQRIIEARANL